MRKRPLIILAAVVAILGAATAIALWRASHPRLSEHFGFQLPATARLVNYHHSKGVFDSGHEFAFAFDDDAMRDAIIRDWGLAPPSGTDHVVSLAQNTAGSWWPRAALDALSEKYGRIDRTRGRYWSLWVDRQSATLYVEYGNY